MRKGGYGPLFVFPRVINTVWHSGAGAAEWE